MSVVQPVASAGLAVLAVFSHVFLKERLRRDEWFAVGIAACGTIGLGLTAEEADDGAVDRRRALLTVGGTLLAVGTLLPFLIAGYTVQPALKQPGAAAAPSNVPVSAAALHDYAGSMAVRSLRQVRVVHAGGDGTHAAAVVGLQAGAAFGMSGEEAPLPCSLLAPYSLRQDV